jgi:hypothetical protein
VQVLRVLFREETPREAHTLHLIAQSSKSSFDLILETFNVQITRSQISSPVLTLPVGAGAGASGRRGGGGG